MKILAVIILHPLRKTSGATTAALELSRAIGKIIPYTVAIMWDKDEILEQEMIKTIRFRAKNLFSPIKALLPRWAYIPLYSSNIPKFIKKGDFDLVHIHNVIPTLELRRVAHACLQKGVPYCLSTHGFMEINNYAHIMEFGIFKKILTKIAINKPFNSVVKNATWIFTLSPQDQEILEKLNFPNKYSSCVTNGVKKIFLNSPSQLDVNNLRQKIGLNMNENPKLLFIGSLHIYKGVDSFLNSLHHIPFAVTAIVGGKFKSNFEKNNLLNRVNASDLKRHNLIFTGWLTDKDLHCLYHIADIFVYPTRSDTLPLSILEAMASRLPIISTRVGGIPFELADGAGFIADSDNPKEIAQLTIKLIKNKKIRIRMGQAARKRVVNIFNWNKSALLVIDSYKKIIKSYKEK